MSETDLNILSIDKKIKKAFEEERNRIPEYKQRLQDLQTTLSSKNLSFNSVHELKNNIDFLNETIEKIENKEEENLYILKTVELIERYKKILKTPMKISFIQTNTRKENKEKNEIIRKFLTIARNYTDEVYEIPEKKYKPACKNCDNKKEFVEVEDNSICQDCGAQEKILQYTTSYKDIDRVNISMKYQYDRKTHFRDCINQYQGKQNCTIEQNVYTKLEETFKSYHLLVGDENTDKKTRFAKVTKNHVLMFLKTLSFSKHYENVNLIHYNMTGQKPDDITHLENKLMNDFDMLIEVYDKHFKHKVDRVNFISTQYILYQLLQRHNHPCKKEDFIILKQVDRQTFHDDITRELFAMLGWNFKSVS